MANPTDPDQTLLDDFFGPLSPVWDTGEGGTTLRTVVVPVTKLYNDPLYGKQRGVAVDQGTNAWLKFVYYSPQTGAPVKFPVGSYSTPPTVEVRFREGVGINPAIYVPDTGDVPTLAADGTYVLLPLPVELKNSPGVFRAQTRILRGDGSEAARDEFMVLVQRGMWAADGSTTNDNGPPTVQEVRTALRDHPGANRLLGEFEFDPAELGSAMVWAVQTFNSTPPVGGRNLDTVTFPRVWRRQWLDGILAHLFDTASAYHRRGQLPYSAGGVSVDDLNKEKDYLRAAEQYRDRFRRWAEGEKVRASVDAGWGSQTSNILW